MPNETNGTPTDNAELVTELEALALALDNIRNDVVSRHTSPMLRRAASALTRLGEAQEIGEFVNACLEQCGCVEFMDNEGAPNESRQIVKVTGSNDDFWECEFTGSTVTEAARKASADLLIPPISRADAAPQTDTKETPNA